MIVQPIKISWFSPLICSIFGRSHFIVLHSKNCLVNRSKNKSPPTRSTFGLPNRGTINRAPLYNNKFTFILELHQVSYKAIVLLSCVMLLCITVNGRRKEDALKGGSICFNQPPLNRRLHFILWPCHAPSSPPSPFFLLILVLYRVTKNIPYVIGTWYDNHLVWQFSVIRIMDMNFLG